MTTWTCKGPLAALFLTSLAACETGQGAAFLGGTGASKTGSTAIVEAAMLGKSITLVAPRGYCIDPRSLTPRFALLARCDVLGQSNSTGGAPLGIITASFSNATPQTPLPTAAQTAKALGLSDVHRTTKHDKSVVFRAIGTAPSDNLAPQHWRATALIGPHMLGLAVYGPKNGAAVTAEGGAILTSLIARTRDKNPG